MTAGSCLARLHLAVLPTWASATLAPQEQPSFCAREDTRSLGTMPEASVSCPPGTTVRTQHVCSTVKHARAQRQDGCRQAHLEGCAEDGDTSQKR